MNQEHIDGLKSDVWAAFLATDLLPWVFEDATIDGHVVEVGPGPGRTTDLLQERFERVSAVEIDEALAADLAARYAESERVSVHQADGAAMPFYDATFAGACSFHRGVERQEIRLPRDLVDHRNDVGDLA